MCHFTAHKFSVNKFIAISLSLIKNKLYYGPGQNHCATFQQEKDSCWLYRIPKHWVTVRLALFTITGETTATCIQNIRKGNNEKTTKWRYRKNASMWKWQEAITWTGKRDYKGRWITIFFHHCANKKNSPEKSNEEYMIGKWWNLIFTDSILMLI